MAETIRSALAIIRRHHVQAVTGLSRASIYLRVKKGTFPKPIQIGPRAVGWRVADIEAWLANPATYRAEAA